MVSQIYTLNLNFSILILIPPGLLFETRDSTRYYIPSG